LTRGSLLAVSKYPWLRGDHLSYSKKWGAYDCDLDTLLWTLEVDKETYRGRVEAQQMDRSLDSKIMDWADDITYAVHDIDDFFRLGLVPLNELARIGTPRNEFLEYAMSTVDFAMSTADEATRLRKYVESWLGLFPERRFGGLPEDIAKINGLVSSLIDLFISSTALEDSQLTIPSSVRYLNAVLKQLTWYYVIDNPALATIQAGQRMMLRDLYSHVYALASVHYLGKPDNVARLKSKRRIPPMLRYYIDYTMDDDRGCKVYTTDEQLMVRGILDFLASLTDGAVQRLHARLSGEPGISILEPAIAM
jgi:dGTPase